MDVGVAVALFLVVHVVAGLAHVVARVGRACGVFFSSRRRHTRSDRDWSSDVCSSDLAAPDPGLPLVRTVCRLIDAHPDRPASLADLSAQAGVTSHRLLRTFQRVLGISPRQYRDARRVDRFKTELRSRGRVSPALYEAGYGSTSRVYEKAHAQLGMTPATYSRGAPGTRIAFTIVPCALGRLLVATTARGICRVSLGGDAAEVQAGQ